MQYEYALRKARLSENGIIFSDETKTEAMILNEMGRRGYRYAGYHPADVMGYGRTNTLALIFERVIGSRPDA
ncbi:MAG: DUF4177 domain-containing protein [Parasporobacterium sp.]|nr:DUF4177 domain-containing protein [Parasporobacterium sp.]